MTTAAPPDGDDWLDLQNEARFVPPGRARALGVGGAVILAVVALAVVLTLRAIQGRHDGMVSELRQQVGILAEARAEVLAAWLDGTLRLTSRIADSELFRLFATELFLAESEGGLPLDAGAPPSGPGQGPDLGPDQGPDQGPEGEPSLLEQIPYMTTVLSDYVTSVGFVEGYLLVNGRAPAFVASAAAQPLVEERLEAARQVQDGGRPRFGPARPGRQGLVLDLYVPVIEAQAPPGEGRAVAVLLFGVPVADKLAELLAPRPAAGPGEHPRLFQSAAAGFSEIRPGATPPLSAIDPEPPLGADGGLSFGRRPRIGSGEPVYSAGLPLADVPWSVVYEIEAVAAESDYRAYRDAAGVVAALSVLVVVATFGAFWWWLGKEHNHALARQFRQLAARIAGQKQFLDSINDTIADHIGLKDGTGKYRYVNPAFAQAVGRPVDEVLGLDDVALFGHGTAQQLAVSDRRAVAERRAATVEEQVYLSGRLHHLQISKVPFKDPEGSPAGLVTVARDVTELVEQRAKTERAMRQMVDALVLAIELRDPYLAGHSRRVAHFAAEVARRCGGDPLLEATVSTAANLSQIGKLGIPVDVLTKPERLDESEIRIMQSHVEQAIGVLSRIDFELPVVEAIEQMHERLDGSGYPKGLREEQISLAGRILGLCDVFCARVEPRVYRSAISPDEALQILAENGRRYDARLVAGLREVVHSVSGEKALEQ